MTAKNPEYVPLSVALVKWGDPNAAREMLELKRDGYDVPPLLYVPGAPPTEFDLKYRRYNELWKGLTTEFIATLLRGELVGTGFVVPLSANPPRESISPELWAHLTFNFEKSEAEGPGIKLIDIRISVGAAEQEQPPHVIKARLRREVRPWLVEEARRQGLSWSKKQYFEAAKAKFGPQLTENLFKEIWRSARLPEGLRAPGFRRSL